MIFFLFPFFYSMRERKREREGGAMTCAQDLEAHEREKLLFVSSSFNKKFEMSE